jgi:hypothetical protein
MSDKVKKTKTKKPAVVQKYVWLLEEGRYYTYGYTVVCVAESKAALVQWVRKNYPKHKKVPEEIHSYELYFENIGSGIS